MKPRHILLLLLLAVNVTFCPDTIIESPNIQDIRNYITQNDCHKDTLVIFDLDNTTYTPTNDFGSSHWFDALFKKYEKKYHDFDSTNYVAVQIYYAAQKYITMQPLEPVTPKLIKDLQATGIKVIALTLKGIEDRRLIKESLEIINCYIEQLKSIDIDFSHAAPASQELDLGDLARYKCGVIFTGINEKDIILERFFDMTGYHPKKIIFIDDKMKNIKVLHEVCKKRGIEYVGIRYSRIDERIRNFNLANTENELQDLFARHPELQQLA